MAQCGGIGGRVFTASNVGAPFGGIVPFTGETKEPRRRLKSLSAEERKHDYIQYEIPYSKADVMAESTRCLQCTCEAIGFCDLRRLGIDVEGLGIEVHGKVDDLPLRHRHPGRLQGRPRDPAFLAITTSGIPAFRCAPAGMTAT